MSGRIRSLKPELLEDEKTASLSDLEFRMFVSLLLMADDHGNLRGDSAYLRGCALWASQHTDEDAADARDKLCEVGLLVPYSVRGQRYLRVANWTRHQKVDRPAKPRVPTPDDPEAVLCQEWKTYFIRLSATGLIKIGKTLNVSRRVASLRSGSGAKPELLLVLDTNAETELHERFKSYRESGDSFRPVRELLDFIEEKKPATIPRESRVSPAGPSRLISDHRSPISDPDEEREAARTGFAETVAGTGKKSKKLDTLPSLFSLGEKNTPRSRDEVHERIFTAWILQREKRWTLNPDHRPQLDDKRRDAIDTALRFGYSVDDLELCVRGFELNAKWEGPDARHFGWALQDAASIDGGIQRAISLGLNKPSTVQKVAAPDPPPESATRLPETG